MPEEELTVDQLKQVVMSLTIQMTDIEHDINEHNRVIESLNKFSGDRKAYYIVGDVMVEGTVAEAAPRVVEEVGRLKARHAEIQQVLNARKERLDQLTQS